MSELEKSVEDYFVSQVTEVLKGKAIKLVLLGLRGWPDRTILLPGGVVKFVELKRPKGGRISPQQHAWAKVISSLGFDIQFIKNKGEVDEWIRANIS